MDLIIIFIILVGLVMGSFLNVVIHRLPEGKSLIYPGSHCVSCQKPIKFYDNIPIISYMVLRGRCRQCGARIPWRYPLVEILTAVCFLSLFLIYGLTPRMFVYGVLILFLIPISFIDVEKGLILNKLTIPGFILGVGLVLGFQIESWLEVLIGALGGGIILLLLGFLGKALFKKECLGMGDVKLIVMIGVYIGFPEVGISLFLGAIVASIFIVIGMIFKKIKLGDTIPFGPFVAIGTLVYLLWGSSILQWYGGFFNYRR
jgi:leader peptidase (prepilin peptidase)/N-methyltransferase